MKKILITGGAGFVSKYFLDFIEANKSSAVILGLDINEPGWDATAFNNLQWEFKKCDLKNYAALEQIIAQFQPEYVLHLASLSSVASSWAEPVASFHNNTSIFLNLLEAIKKSKPDSRILAVGSSEEYGKAAAKDLPLTEGSPLNPINPYAVARVAQEMLARVYVTGYGLDVVSTRSFNHIGPGQKDSFVVSSFVKQLVELKKKKINPGRLVTGQVDLIRDFLDVRDVVAAYFTLMTGGAKGEVYNVCSGRGVSLLEIIQLLGKILEIEVELEINAALIRPTESLMVIGSNEKIGRELGWQPRYTLEDSLNEIIAYWMKVV